MAKRTVRITRIWDVEVKAEYGDTDESLMEKAKPGNTNEAVETRTLLPASDA